MGKKVHFRVDKNNIVGIKEEYNRAYTNDRVLYKLIKGVDEDLNICTDYIFVDNYLVSMDSICERDKVTKEELLKELAKLNKSPSYNKMTDIRFLVELKWTKGDKKKEVLNFYVPSNVAGKKAIQCSPIVIIDERKERLFEEMKRICLVKEKLKHKK